jgi:putative ABC transport system substrate-binding protein
VALLLGRSQLGRSIHSDILRRISYRPDLIDQIRRAGTHIDRILRGEKPGDLPVQQPAKFELVVNPGTAKALGLTIPSTMLALAYEVIE